MSDVQEFLDEVTIKKGDIEVVLKEPRLREIIDSLIEATTTMAFNDNKFSQNIRLIESIVEVKKAFFPETQKTIQGTVDFSKSLDRWVMAQKDLIKEKNTPSAKSNKTYLEVTPISNAKN